MVGWGIEEGWLPAPCFPSQRLVCLSVPDPRGLCVQSTLHCLSGTEVLGRAAPRWPLLLCPTLFLSPSNHYLSTSSSTGSLRANGQTLQSRNCLCGGARTALHPAKPHAPESRGILQGCSMEELGAAGCSHGLSISSSTHTLTLLLPLSHPYIPYRWPPSS